MKFFIFLFFIYFINFQIFSQANVKLDPEEESNDSKNIPIVKKDAIEPKENAIEKKEATDVKDPSKKEEISALKKPNYQLLKELVYAAEYGNFLGVRNSVEMRLVNLDSKDKRGITAIHAAAQNGQMEIVRYLLQFKVDINTVAKNGETPLIGTLARGHLNLAKLLIENNAEINTTDKNGRTPLMLASGNGHFEIVKLLVEKNAKLNLKDFEGNTALMQSLLAGNTEILKYLVQNKADVNIKNKDGKSATTYATENGLTDIVEYLSKNEDQIASKHEVYVGEVSYIKDDVANIKPEIKTKLEVNHVIYFIDEKGEESGKGRITVVNPKFYKVKIDSGEIQAGNKAVYYK